MAIVKKMTKRGFTLIELMIVVVIIGILAALAIYGVQKYVANSKSAEARMMLGRISKDHLSAFEGERQVSSILAFGSSAGVTRTLCPDILGANASVAAVPSGEKTQPDPGKFKSPNSSAIGSWGWYCLGFSVSTPTYYQYTMTSSNTTQDVPTTWPVAANGDAFEAIALGNLDADAQTSRFGLGGQVAADASGSLELVLATTVSEVDPEE